MASGFDVAFITDPVGPKALPYLAAAVLIGTGLGIAMRPGAEPEWPQPGVRGRLALAILVFLAYSVALPVLGFWLATTIGVAALSMLFGGGLRETAAAAAALSTVLWYLFVWALRLPLPLGSLWTF